MYTHPRASKSGGPAASGTSNSGACCPGRMTYRSSAGAPGCIRTDGKVKNSGRSSPGPALMFAKPRPGSTRWPIPGPLSGRQPPGKQASNTAAQASGPRPDSFAGQRPTMPNDNDGTEPRTVPWRC
jgi:hypothetical protein